MTTSRRVTIPAVLLLLFSTIISSPARADFKKTKIAVLDFTIQGEETTKDMGKIVSEWLITGLVETGRFDVIERRMLEKIMEEHKLGMTGIVDPESIAQLGKVLGVKTIVTGTVLSFEGMVEINARLISVETASIIAAEKVKASSAARLNELVSQITEKIVMSFPLEGYIVQRTGSRVTIDLGRRMGVKPGMEFIAFKEGRVIKHPKTGEVLDVETIVIGEIEITDIRDKTAIGTIIKEISANAVEYGSMVRSAIKGQIVNLEEVPELKPAPKPKQEERPRSSDTRPPTKTVIPPPMF